MIRVFDSYEALSRAAAEEIRRLGRECVAQRGRFDLVLAGGKTPCRTYELLRETTASDHELWSATRVYWGDE